MSWHETDFFLNQRNISKTFKFKIKKFNLIFKFLILVLHSLEYITKRIPDLFTVQSFRQVTWFVLYNYVCHWLVNTPKGKVGENTLSSNHLSAFVPDCLQVLKAAAKCVFLYRIFKNDLFIIYHSPRNIHFFCSLFSWKGEQLFPILWKILLVDIKALLAHIFAFFQRNNSRSLNISSRISFLLTF